MLGVPSKVPGFTIFTQVTLVIMDENETLIELQTASMVTSPFTHTASTNAAKHETCTCAASTALYTHAFSAAQSESAICPELSVLEQLVPANQEHTLAIPHAFLKQPRKEKAAIKPLLVPN